MIKVAADNRLQGMSSTPYFFGYLMSRVGQFLTGHITEQHLAEDHAMVELLITLDARCSGTELLEIASGTREVPGEDVQSGQ